VDKRTGFGVRLRDKTGWRRMKSSVIGQARPICGGKKVIGSADFGINDCIVEIADPAIVRPYFTHCI